jgi:hypothetical protein
MNMGINSKTTRMTTTTTPNNMQEITILLTDLVRQNKLSYPEAESFLDFAYDLDLNGVEDEEIESIITKLLK